MNSNLKVLIVEDSISYAIELERIVSSLGFDICAVVDNSAEALEAIFFHGPDVILMDIQINGKLTGVDIGQKIIHLDIPILYISSISSEKVINEAQNSKMVGYLVKPVSETKLINELNQIASSAFEINENGDASVVKKPNDSRSFLFKKNGLFKKINFNDIIYVEADDNYCNFVTEEGKFMLRINISQVEEITSRYNFYRVHRKYIVNITHVLSFSKINSNIQLEHNLQVPLSRRKKTSFIKLMET